MADIAADVAELVAMLDEEEADEIIMKRATAKRKKVMAVRVRSHRHHSVQ